MFSRGASWLSGCYFSLARINVCGIPWPTFLPFFSWFKTRLDGSKTVGLVDGYKSSLNGMGEGVPAIQLRLLEKGKVGPNLGE